MRRSTIVLVVLFAALGLLYWYMQKPENVIKQAIATSTVPAPEVLPSMLRPDQGPVSQISIQRADGKKVTLKKAGGIWLAIADYEATANQESAEMIARSLLSLRTVAKLEKTPDLASVGLSTPAYTASLILLDGSPYTFKIGNVTVTGNGYYIQTNDSNIIVVDKYSIDAITRLIDEPPFLQTATPGTTSIPDVTPTTKP